MKTLIVGMIVLSVGLFAVAFDYTMDRMFAAVGVVELASR